MAIVAGRKKEKTGRRRGGGCGGASSRLLVLFTTIKLTIIGTQRLPSAFELPPSTAPAVLQTDPIPPCPTFTILPGPPPVFEGRIRVLEPSSTTAGQIGRAHV